MVITRSDNGNRAGGAVKVSDFDLFGWQVRLALAIAGYILWLYSTWEHRGAFKKMIDDVNAQLPAEKRFDLFWWHSSKYYRLYSEYHRPFPEGPHLKSFMAYTRSSWVAACVGALLLFGVPFGIFAALWFAVAGAVLQYFTFRHFR